MESEGLVELKIKSDKRHIMPPKAPCLTDEQFTVVSYKRIAEENQDIPNKMSGVNE
jgi:hypothetical protein